MQLFLDMDGVLADFNKAAKPLMDGMEPEDFEAARGSDEFWKRVHQNPLFFYELEPMPDMWILYNGVRHLNPTICTGIPQKMDAFKNQKVDWRTKTFGLDQPIICCPARKKSQYCKPGDIIIDDRTIYKHLWEKAGGTYIVHTSAENSLKELEALGVL